MCTEKHSEAFFDKNFCFSDILLSDAKNLRQAYQICILLVQGDALKKFQSLNCFLFFSDFPKLCGKRFFAALSRVLTACSRNILKTKNNFVKFNLIFYRIVRNIFVENWHSFFNGFVKTHFRNPMDFLLESY